MDMLETAKLIALARQAFPTAKDVDAKVVTGMWCSALSKYSYEICKYALREYISTNKYFPAPAEIREIAEQIENACKYQIFDIFGVMLLNADFENRAVSQYVTKQVLTNKALSGTTSAVIERV